MFQWRNLFKGVAIGVTDLVPGISGATIALALGIYQSLLAAINGIFTRQWKKHVLFLLPVGVGIVCALFAFSRLIEWLLLRFPQPTFFFFLGLIIGVIPSLLKEIEFKRTFTPFHYTLLIIGAALVASTIIFKKEDATSIIGLAGLGDYLLLFFAGWLASTAMILPGVSGSFVFLLLGVYPTVVNALSTINISVIITVGVGVAIGMLLTSRLVSFLLARFKTATYATMIGAIAGSMIVIYPGFSGSALLLLSSVIALFAGGFVAYRVSSIGSSH